MSIYSTGVTALLAAQTNIDTIGHNIANANTTGYRRQEVAQSARAALATGSGYIGQGVNVTTVQRAYDAFLERQVSQNEAQVSYQETYLQGAKQVDSILGDSDSGLSSALQSFFQAWSDLATSPTSQSARVAVVGAANTVANSINTTGAYLQSLQTGVNSQITDMVGQINTYSQNIARLNQQISLAQISGQTPNDLMDQRDTMVSELNQLTGVSVVRDSASGNYNIFMGGGTPLVLGSTYSTLSASASPYDSSRMEVYDGSGIPISTDLSGGQLGGVLAYRSEVLDTAQNELGRLALSVTSAVNAQQAAGVDDNGNVGGDFFNSMLTAPATYRNSNNTSAATITAAVPSNASAKLLTGSDYSLTYDGTNYTLTRSSDGTSWSNANPATLATTANQGFSLSVTGAPAAGDKFLIRPTVAASNNVTVALTEATTSLKLIAVKGAGAASTDTLNNTNALAMAALQDDATLVGGSSTVGGGYATLVSRIGSLTSNSKVSYAVQKSLLDQAQSAQQSVSGVNLDEEAANLLRFQQAYQAAAQIFKTAQTMFDTLLTSVGG